jgi:hypothetical protein
MQNRGKTISSSDVKCKTVEINKQNEWLETSFEYEVNKSINALLIKKEKCNDEDLGNTDFTKDENKL